MLHCMFNGRYFIWVDRDVVCPGKCLEYVLDLLQVYAKPKVMRHVDMKCLVAYLPQVLCILETWAIGHIQTP